MARSIEPFGRLPARLADELNRGEMSFYGFTILCWLTALADWREVNLGVPPNVTTSVREMHAALDWPHGEQQLAKELRALRAANWISYDVKSGSRRAFTIYLTERSAIRELVSS